MNILDTSSTPAANGTSLNEGRSDRSNPALLESPSYFSRVHPTITLKNTESGTSENLKLEKEHNHQKSTMEQLKQSLQDALARNDFAEVARLSKLCEQAKFDDLKQQLQDAVSRSDFVEVARLSILCEEEAKKNDSVKKEVEVPSKKDDPVPSLQEEPAVPKPTEEVSPPISSTKVDPPSKADPPKEKDTQKEAEPTSAKEIVPPPSKEIVPEPSKEISPPAKEIVPPPSKEIVPEPSKEVSPPAKEIAPAPSKEEGPPEAKEASPPPANEVEPPLTEATPAKATRKSEPVDSHDTQDSIPEGEVGNDNRVITKSDSFESASSAPSTEVEKAEAVEDDASAQNAASRSKTKAQTRKSLPTTPHTAGYQAKPKMDLRHILKKHEKKPEIKPVEHTDFYGSMSAIPFLKAPKQEEKKKKKKKKSSTKATSADRTKEDNVLVMEEEEEIEPVKIKPGEITITAEYTDDQLQMWKSMNALDAVAAAGNEDRPPDMLPLMPGVRAARKPKPRPDNAERAYRRHDDWLNPNLKTPEKMTYMVKKDKAAKELPSIELDPAGEATFVPTSPLSVDLDLASPSRKQLSTEAPAPVIDKDVSDLGSLLQTIDEKTKKTSSPPDAEATSQAGTVKSRISAFSGGGSPIKSPTSVKKATPDLGALLRSVDDPSRKTTTRPDADAISHSGTVKSRISAFSGSNASTTSPKPTKQKNALVGKVKKAANETDQVSPKPTKQKHALVDKVKKVANETDQTDALLNDMKQAKKDEPQTPSASASSLHNSAASFASRELNDQDKEYKRMANLGPGESVGRPDEMLPLQPGPRRSPKKSKHKIVGQGRPEEWLSPGKKSPTKVSITIKKQWDVEGEPAEKTIEGIPSL